MAAKNPIAGMERLAEAFTALAPGAPDVMVDRQTGTPAGAVSWESGRRFRVRVRSQAGGDQASAYFRMQSKGLEMMSSASVRGDGGGAPAPEGSGTLPENAWSAAPAGDAGVMAASVVAGLRQRLAGGGKPKG
jgi:hypothetical protein